MVVISIPLSFFRTKKTKYTVLILLLSSLNWTVLAENSDSAENTDSTESTVSLSTHYYSMKPGLTITKPILAYENNLSLDTKISAKLTVDRVATDYEGFDAVSSASQYQGSLESGVDTRQEYVASVSQTLGDWALDVGYLASVEQDYVSNSPSISISKDFNRRNTSLSLGYAHNFDRVNGLYMDDEETKNVDNISTSITQVLSPVSLFQLAYTLQHNRGFLSTGNRQIVLENDVTYSEYLPSTRVRQAVGFRLAYWLKSKTALHFSYRRYQDDWELSSNTFAVKAYQTINSQWQIRGEIRLYDQSKTSFFKNNYDGTEQYLTSASSLNAFSSRLYGIKVSYKPLIFPRSRFEMKYERYSQSTGLFGDIVMMNMEFVY